MAKINQIEWHYTANGMQRDFAVPFVYIAPTDVVVRLNGAPTTAFTLQSSGYVRMNLAPAKGVKVTVIRNTDARNPLHVFQQGSPLLPQPLDENFRQVLYAVEEGVRAADIALNTSGATTTLAEQALSISNQANQKAGTAISTATSAESLAQTAVSTSTSAVSSARSAVSTAGTALSTANSAASTAETAASNASIAFSTAVTAASDADTARKTANAASRAASTAVNAANTAAEDASQALNTANQALMQAGTADGNAQSAKLTAQTASRVASAAIDTADRAAADAAAALLAAGTASSAAQTAVQTAEGIDAKATQALSESGDAITRVAQMEDVVAGIESGGVTNFNGRVGAVVPEAGDYSYDQITGLQNQLDSKLGLDDLTSNLGGAAKLDVGTTAGTVAAGDDSRIVSAVPNTRTVNGKQLNGDISLTAADVSAVPTSRTVNGRQLSTDISLDAADVGAAATSHTHTAAQVSGLGDSATRNVGTTSGTVAAGDDPRLSDARDWDADVVPKAVAEAGFSGIAYKWTPVRVKEAVLKHIANAASGIGTEQSWSNVTSSRGFSAIYTNGTDKPIMVNVYTGGTPSNSAQGLRLYVGNVLIDWSTVAYTNTRANVSAIVPPGEQYRVEKDLAFAASTSIGGWFELR